jgi:hypothetical protein
MDYTSMEVNIRNIICVWLIKYWVMDSCSLLSFHKSWLFRPGVCDYRLDPKDDLLFSLYFSTVDLGNYHYATEKWQDMK